MGEVKPDMSTPKPEVGRPPTQPPPTAEAKLPEAAGLVVEQPPTTKQVETPVAPERRERIEGRLQKIWQATKNFHTDVKNANKLALRELGQDTALERLMAGLEVTGIGVGMEWISDAFLWGTVSRFFGTGGQYELKTTIKLAPTPEEATARAAAQKGSPRDETQRRLERRESANIVSIDEGGNIHTVSAYLDPQEQVIALLASKGLRNKNIVAALLESGQDFAIAAMYGGFNRMVGHIFPDLPNKFVARSLIGDFVGKAALPALWEKFSGEPNTTSAETGGAQTQTTVAGAPTEPKKDMGAKLRGVAAEVFNLTNPVSLFGISLVGDGIGAYYRAFKDLRAYRKAVAQGTIKPEQVYVGEGQWSEGQNKGRFRQYQGGRHG